MNNEVTDKTHVMVVQGVGRIYITGRQAEAVKHVLQDGTAQTVVIGENLVMVSAIHAVVPASELVNLDRYKQGDYKCKFDQWHSKGMKCNCAEAKRLGML